MKSSKSSNWLNECLVISSLVLTTLLVFVPAHATTIEFTGTLGVVETDNGSSVYSGLSVGDTITGRITYGNSAAEAVEVIIVSTTNSEYIFENSAYGGFFNSGSTTTVGSSVEGVEVRIHDDDAVGDLAVFINNLFGAGSIVASDIADSWGVDAGSNTGGNNFQFFGVQLSSLNTSLFNSTDFQALPPALAQTDFGFFFVAEGVEPSGENFYLATGQLTSITVVPDPVPACGTLLTSDTTLNANMVCAGTALFFSGVASNNIVLDCAGFSITTTRSSSSPAISAFNTSGVEIRNCDISTAGISANGISLNNTTNSVISDNIIATEATSAHGINISRSSNNLIDGNTITAAGISARAIQIQNRSSDNIVSNNNVVAALGQGIRIRSASDNNTVSQNNIESSTAHAIDIQSASNNQFDGNTFISPFGYLRLRNLTIQNGGTSVDSAGNIFAVENNFGSNSGSGGRAATLVQVDPNTGDPISYLRLVAGGTDLGFGFDSLEIMPDGRFLATRGGPNSLLYEIDSISGEVTPVPLTLPVLVGSMNGLQSVDANTLLATTNAGELLSIDLDSSTATRIGQDGDGWSDLALHPTSGRLYTVSRWSAESSGTSHLYEIDPDTGLIIQKIGDMGDAFISDIDFSFSGILYATNLYTVDIATGLATLIGGFTGDPHEPPSLNNTLANQSLVAPSASVLFQQTINLPALLDLSLDTNAIQLKQNRIFIESAIFPSLDVPARITFENLGGTSRDLLVDPEDDGTFVPCLSPQCTFVSFTGGTLIFDVAGFTTYSSEEADPDGDGDGVPDGSDNCPSVPNADQLDSNGNGVGDVCEPPVEAVVPEALTEITALLVDPSTSVKAANKLDKAKDKLEKAQNQLGNGDVKKGLKEIGKATKELQKAENQGADIADLIGQLVESSRLEAQGAIDAAIASGGTQKDIDKALAEMVRAQADLDKGKPDKAINHYRHAWEQARKAL